MGGRKREIKYGVAPSQRIRVVPIWKQRIDPKRLAKILVLMSLHQVAQNNAESDESPSAEDTGQSKSKGGEI
jgi:hypothetical protein